MISTALLVAAFICFLLAMLNVPSGKISWLPAGLALWTLSILLAGK